MHRIPRLLRLPAVGLAALAVAVSVAAATTGQPKPQVSAEAERTVQGAKLIVKGKNWPAKSRIKLTATRAPGSSKAQEFGMLDTDDKGVFEFRKTVQCSTTRMEDAMQDPVTFTAADSATSVKATAKVDGGAWVCQ